MPESHGCPQTHRRLNTAASGGLVAVVMAGLIAAGALPAAAATPEVDLLAQANIQINGAAASDASGSSVNSAGDVNGDHIGDVVVGAPDADNNSRADSGSAYVLFGSTTPTSPVSLSSLGSAGFRIDGAAAGDSAGFSVNGAGDVNGDGKADVIVGAPNADNNSRSASGSTYVIYGSALPVNVDLAALGSAGFRMDGAAASDNSGWSVDAAGDVDGNGKADVIVGAPSADNNSRLNSGSSYVVYGTTSPVNVDLAALGSAGFRIDGGAAGVNSGASIAGAGDVTGDGKADVIVGAPSADNNSRANSGSSYVVYGTTSPVNVDLAALGSAGFRMDGAAAGDLSGASVNGAGDVNGDGKADVIVGAPVAASSAGASYTVLGSSSPTNVDFANLGAAGFQISGAAANDTSGSSVAGAGDVNGDGKADIIVGAPTAGNNSRANSGSSYVVFGSATPANVSLADLGAAGFQIDGAASGDKSGTAVAGAGDVNGDGKDDVLTGAPSATSGAGVSYVVYGPPSKPLSVTATSGEAKASVSWAVPATNGSTSLSGYKVQYSTSASGPFLDGVDTCAASSTTISTATSCQLTGLTPRQQYWVRVAGINSVAQGPWSESASVIPAKHAQTIGACGTLPTKLKFKGITRLLEPKCRTNAKKFPTVRAQGKQLRGDLLLYRLITNKKKHSVSIQTFGVANLRIAVSMTAPATAQFKAYRQAKVYRPKR